MAETLQDGAIHDHAVSLRFLEIIIGEVERLTRLLEDLLILSRSESQIPERAPFALDGLISEVAERFQARAEKSGVSLVTNIARDLVVSANRDQMEQVVVNLVDNGIKYTPNGGQVKVSTRTTHVGVTVEVEDTGMGILSQDLPRLWERFYRTDRARSRQSGGTGLGLAIVKHIIENHGGSVAVASEYGVGSKFSFFIPY
jgi:two-component system phosphate regulon sensor histidine kinase PhoR